MIIIINNKQEEDCDGDLADSDMLHCRQSNAASRLAHRFWRSRSL
jgi:hypothetical protein